MSSSGCLVLVQVNIALRKWNTDAGIIKAGLD
jgi:hypothetical protein